MKRWGKVGIICVISFCSLGCLSDIQFSTQEYHASGLLSQWSPTIRQTVSELEVRVLRTDWSTQGWRKGQVTILQAFGYRGQGFKFPSYETQLPNKVAGSRQGASGGSGARGGSSPTPTTGSEAQNAALGKQMVEAAGWGSQWDAFNNIVMAESGWNVTATNPSSGAYGIPQALPGSKMASAGANWQTSAATQIKWMIGYILATYGNPNNAWAFHLANGWY